MPNNDKIGLLYSTATGIVLRTINPTHREQRHLDWVQRTKPEGTTLLLLDKIVVGADDKNCPNLDMLIPHVKQNHGITLSFGVPCSVVDPTNTVIKTVICCPVLYRNKLLNDPITTNHVLVENGDSVGEKYDPVAKNFIK